MGAIRPFWTALPMIAGAAALLLLVSCSSGRSYIDVARGNSAFERGSYQDATVAYLSAQRSGSYPDWVAYDLGNVYHALGEPDGAAQEWAKAEKAKDARVVVATLFNEGELDYELGRYRDAYDKFRRVLEITPSDIDAKVNLELSFSKMTTKEVPPRSGTQGEPIAVKHADAQANQLLDIVRQKEKGVFTPPEPQQSKVKVSDW